MKILMVISEAPPVRSGVARVAEKLTGGLAERGHQIDVLSLADIPRWEWGEIRLSSMPFKLADLREKFCQYDLIHLHGPVPTFSDVFLLRGLDGAKRDRPPIVYTHHAPVDLRFLPLRPFIILYNNLQERMAGLADHIVVSTPSYRQRLGRYIPAEKLSVIPWGVDFDRFAASPDKPGPFTVVYLGQIRPYKGLPVLLKAADGLADMRVWVIGDGHHADKSRQLSDGLDLPDLTFWGHVPDAQMIELLQQAHVLVLPSITRSEAFGIVLLEGMAAGMVPVASHLPGVADVVGNEGYTFSPGDPGSLASILKRLRDDSSLRIHRAILAQAKARLYPWDRVIFGYDRIFRQLGPEEERHPAEPRNGRSAIPILASRETMPVWQQQRP